MAQQTAKPKIECNVIHNLIPKSVENVAVPVKRKKKYVEHGQDDDAEFPDMYGEVRKIISKAKVIRKRSGGEDRDLIIKMGPDFIDENYFECTPIPLWKRKLPVFNYDKVLEKKPQDVKALTPIRAKTFTSVITLTKNREVNLLFDPELTDLEEEFFYEKLIDFPSEKLAYNLPKERQPEKAYSRRVKMKKPTGEVCQRTQMFTKLSETKTMKLLVIKSSLRFKSAQDGEYKLVEERNETYLKMVKNHQESDSYVDNCSQCFKNHTLSSQSDYRITACVDVGINCRSYYIVDDYIEVQKATAQQKKKAAEEQAAKALAEKSHGPVADSAKKQISSNLEAEMEKKDSDEEVGMYEGGEHLSKYLEDEQDDNERMQLLEEASEDEVPLTSDEEEFTLRKSLEEVYDKRAKKNKEVRGRVYPDISFTVIQMQRIIGMNYTHEKQADMRGFVVPGKIQPKPPIIDLGAGGDFILDKFGDDEEDEDKETKLSLTDVLADSASVLPGQDDLDADETDASKTQPTAPVEEETEYDEFDQIDERWMDDEFNEEVIEVDRPVQKKKHKMSTPAMAADVVSSEGQPGSAPESVASDHKTEASATPETQQQDESDAMKGAASKESVLTEPEESYFDFLDDGLGLVYSEWTDEDSSDVDEDITQEYIPDSDTDKDCEPVSSDEEHFEALKTKKSKGNKEKSRHKKLLAELAAARRGDDECSLNSSEEERQEELERLIEHEILQEASEGTGEKDETVQVSALLNDSDEEELEPQARENIDVFAGPSLKKFWTFKCSDTQHLEVMDIQLHPSNGNLFAVAYGSYAFGNSENEGLICIWNAKNVRAPERVYKTPSPATVLGFSKMIPYALAVAMLDGNINIIDTRESEQILLGSSAHLEERHHGPIWQLHWVVTQDATSADVSSEYLFTLGEDGLLRKWTLTKGLEATIAMKISRSPLPIPGRREKRSESLITSRSIAFSMCYYPNSTDEFLIGTEEGYIHKCATAYKDQYVTTFVGHSGPVYCIQFSPFHEHVFISGAGDWTVRIWKEDYPTPLLTMQTGYRSIFDIACSAFSSTIFICATDDHMEIWDLNQNTLEPVISHKTGLTVVPRRVAFSEQLNTVIEGDDEGTVNIYGLRKFAEPPSDKYGQIDQLMEALLPGYSKRKGKDRDEDSSLKSRTKT